MSQDYYYTGVDVVGQPATGLVKAATREQALAELQAQGTSVVELTEVLRHQQRRPFEIPELFGIPPKQVTFFTRQLSYLLRAGVLLTDALQSLVELSASRGLRKVLETVSAKVQTGSSLSVALQEHPVFSPLYCSLIRIGESTGTMPEAADRLASTLEAEEDLRTRVRSAATYPTVVLGFSLLLMYGMLVLVFPGFIPMFEEGGVNLKSYPVTSFLIAASRLVNGPGLLGLIVVAGLAYALHGYLLRQPAVAAALGRLAWRLPWLGGTLQLVVLARVARTMAALVNSGIPLADGLDLAAQASGNPVAAEALRKMRLELEGGRDVTAALAEAGIFPPLMVQMVRVGSQAGELGPALEKVAEYYEKEASSTLEAMTSVLEPALVVGVGCLVAVFIVGILLPLLGMVGALDKG